MIQVDQIRRLLGAVMVTMPAIERRIIDDVVVPSMPGYGFSDRPTSRGMNVFRVAELWTNLMHELGYDRFAIQGGDIGAAVTIALGMRHADRLTGVHLNFIFPSYRPYLETAARLAPAEEEYIARMTRWSQESGAYAHIQATRPQTPAYGLNDSPAGLAAWIVEKFREWSDCDGDVYRLFTRDELLTNVTLYWMTQTIHSSFRIYLENRKAPLQFAHGEFIKQPCAVCRSRKLGLRANQGNTAHVRSGCIDGGFDVDA